MSEHWYLYKDQQEGPFTWDEIVKQAEMNTVGPADMVWTEGLEEWTRADQIEGLIPVAASPPPGPISAPPPTPEASNIQLAAAGVPSSAFAGNPEKADMADPSTGQKTSTGLEPNVAGLLCYILGWISGIIFFLVESENKFIRFHAMQSIVTFGGLTVLQILVSILNRLLLSILWQGLGSWAMYSTVAGLLGIVTIIIWLATLGLAVLLMIKAYQYETFKLPIAGNIAEKQLQ